MTLAVLIIPIIIVAIVVVTWASDIGETDFEQCLGELARKLSRWHNPSIALIVTGIMAAWNASLITGRRVRRIAPRRYNRASEIREAAQDVMDRTEQYQTPDPATPLSLI